MSKKVPSVVWSRAENIAREPDRISFSGGEFEDVTLFLQSVQRVALATGRYQDDAWRAAYLATCLTGEVVRWYFLLEDETRNTWALLCRALLQNYFPIPIIPVPAAASETRGLVTQSSIQSVEVGRLKIVTLDETLVGYVARDMNLLSAYQQYSKNPSDALIVVIPHDRSERTRWSMKTTVGLHKMCDLTALADASM
ncbi:hypothetical protein FRB94_014563 [Tulasnella sp. JGI-2019a]|nr:hypothetical protein FRB93_010988 [Tulasnella sp. JGI-2019a]KAG9007180.1 hypothetical protein FRB94_014563 [Tulasnella sp. JGI-2019a]